MKFSKKLILAAVALGALSASGVLLAQDPQQTPPPPASGGGWRRATDPPPAQTSPDQAPPAQTGALEGQQGAPQQNPPQQYPPPQYPAQPYPQQQYPPQPYPAQQYPQQQPYPQQQYPPQQYPPQYQQGYPPTPASQGQWQRGWRQDPNQQNAPGNNAPNMQPPPPIPARLTLKAGTFVTIRMNQPLSSDRNQVGDAFTATLAEPIVIDGVVVAQRGQMVAGRVAEAQKAGRVSGVSRLGIQVTQLTLADGQQVPIQAQLINRKGNTSVGRDAAAIGGTTALGAAVGAAADWGRGAAIGAGAGAVVGTLGVLLTRGNPTVIPPEAVLTFSVDQPVAISTEHAPDAFQWVDPREDYSHQAGYGFRGGPPAPPYGPSAYGPYGYAPAPAGYPYYGSPYAYWPTFGFGYGPRSFYGYGPRFYVRGWRR